jgi:hypothetical protein
LIVDTPASQLPLLRTLGGRVAWNSATARNIIPHEIAMLDIDLQTRTFNYEVARFAIAQQTTCGFRMPNLGYAPW